MCRVIISLVSISFSNNAVFPKADCQYAPPKRRLCCPGIVSKRNYDGNNDDDASLHLPASS